ncbi:hypothetical protein [Nocardia wallacei]|uniref:hypothetical protein n=1 Tax=Nocardia wallacei TaxID=480035 RepID=UPI0024568840|nr:hypothetical protein [Nocardia wallacei]
MTQLDLFPAPSAPSRRRTSTLPSAFAWTEDTWGVYVDECSLNAVGRAADLWAETWMRMDRLGRTIQLDHLVPPGGIWIVAFGDTEDDCEFARDYMIGKGIHPKCLAVMTLGKARASVQRRHRSKSYGPEHSCRFCREVS